MTEDSSASGYISDSFEGIKATFTDIETIHAGKNNFVLRAKRFGRFWALKGYFPADNVSGKNNEAERQKLRKEFDILAELTHPAIVSVVGIEEVEDKGTCIVMEYVEGETLDKWLARCPSLSRRRNVARQLVDAMAYVHSKSIAHRDLKPSNIMVTQNGDMVKVIDFGLADTDSHAVFKQPAGTPRYMSPEQALQTIPDMRNDVYSLGIVLAEMKVGWHRIVRRCLRPLPKRYRNAGELGEAIRRRRHIVMSLWLVLGAAVLAMSIIAVMMRLEQVNRRNDTNLMTNDSLRTVISVQSQLIQSQVQSIDSLKTLNRIKDESTKHFNETVENGFAQLRQLLAKSDFKHHVDTLSDFNYYKGTVEIKHVMVELMEATDAFIKSLGNECSDTEKAQMRTMMMNYAQSLVDPLNDKVNNLKTKGQ